MQYADDITLVISAETVHEAEEAMNNALAEFGKYAAGNRLAAEPAKTQLMVCTTNRRIDHKMVRCHMDGKEIEPAETMKLLGVTLDRRLSWEVHNAKAAGKASGIARAVARGAKILKTADRAALIRSLAHPHLDYCQAALAHPSAAALNSIRRAYNRTARIAARLPRKSGMSERARKKLDWPEWLEKVEAVCEALAASVWSKGEPECLRSLMPETDSRETGVTRADRRGELPEPIVGRTGRKAFRSWAPEAHNRTCKKTGTRQPPEEQQESGDKKPCNAPPDSDAIERAGYYGYLEDKYKDQQETVDEDGRVVVCTDGSALKSLTGKKSAGAGIFYGESNMRNKAVRVDGPQTNQRAELSALLYCLENEQRPVHIKTDSRYVQLGVVKWRHMWKAKAWYKSPRTASEIDHADLWQKVDSILQSRGSDSIKVTWIKAHALPRHIQWGLTTEQDIWANNGADKLAGLASAQLAGTQVAEMTVMKVFG
jgi:ribonuclease HI